MGIFNRFPYSSTHEMNLDFMLGKAQEINEQLQHVETGMQEVQTGLAQISEQTERATAAATAAEEAKEDSQQNERDAFAWAEQAEQHADRAAAALAQMTDDADRAEAAADRAEAAADAASISASAASNSANIASQNAATAAQQAANAQLSAQSAQGALNQATVAANNAQTNAVSAADAAALASGYNSQAATSATNAATSAASVIGIEQNVQNLVEGLPEDFTALTTEVNELHNSFDEVMQEKIGINIFDNNYDASGYIDDGVDKPSTSYVRTTNFYPVDASKGTLYVYHQNAGTVSLLFFDASQNWIRNVNIGAAGTTTVTIPTNAAYYRSYKNVSVTDGITISYSYVTSYIPYEEYIGLKNNSVDYDMLTDDVKARFGLPLLGKTIAFMGDSIIGNFYDSTGICAILAEKTGATVINCGFGGTRFAYNHGANIQYTYMNAISGAGLAGAIASGTWTDQDTAIAGLTGVPDYFASRLTTIKAIDWSTIDFIMWEYGTNDFANAVELSDTSDPTNLYAFDNAYRYAIETILAAYPNIRIIPVTPFYRWWQSSGVFTDDSNTHTIQDYAGHTNKLTDFVDMAQTISKEYQLPCIDDYYTTGANRYSRLAYFDSTDGAHPNANGRKRIAEHIAAQLLSLV